MSMHQFDTDVAKEHGIEGAIILQNMLFWTEKNIANKRHFYDGRFWTYNSVKAFSDLFPYMSSATIRRTLKKLEENELIITGRYNKRNYDRTLWYSLTEKAFVVLKSSICYFEQMDLSESANGFVQNDKPIPDINPVEKKDDKKQIEKPEKEKIPNEVHLLIEKAYIDAYKELKKQDPKIFYPAVRKRQKILLENGFTQDDIILAIQEGKKDRWLVGNGFDFLTLLSEKILPRLVNQARASSPQEEKEAPKCPRCGKKLSALFCDNCMIQFNSQLEEI